MPLSNEENGLRSTRPPRQRSIRTTGLMVLLPLSILSISLVAGITYLRGRKAIEHQVNSHLDATLNALKTDFDKWITTKLIRLDLAVRQPDFKTALESFINQEINTGPDVQNTRETLLDGLRDITQRGDTPLFNQFFISQPDGLILAATVPEWEQQSIINSAFFHTLSNETGSLVVYNPEPLFESGTIVITSMPYYDSQANHLATVYGLSGSLSLVSLLEEGARFTPSGQSYIITQSGNFLRVDPYQNTLNFSEPFDQQAKTLMSMVESSRVGDSGDQNYIIETHSFDGTPVIANYTWLSSIKAGIIVEVPKAIAFGELYNLGPNILAVTLLLGAVVATVIWIATKQLAGPIQLLTTATEEFSRGNWDKRTAITRNNEIGRLSQAFNLMADDLSESYRSLEIQVQERTISLEDRSRQLEATAQVAREAAAILNLDELLTDTTQLISDYFGYYHVGIFLLDANRQYAVLQASNSEGGKKMLARAHRLPVGQIGVVGYAAGIGLPRIALDVGEDTHFFDNPDLPDTHSELALPLKFRQQVIGVLDVQSKNPGEFQGSEVEVLQILADQIAVSIENARLLEQSQNAIQELKRSSSQQVRSDWSRWIKDQTIAYSYDQVRVIPATREQLNAIGEIDTDEPEIIFSRGNSIMTVPIQLRNQKLGSIILQREGATTPWTPEDLEIVRNSIAQITIALENVRLLEMTQRRAAQGQLVSQITTRMRETLDLETILKTATEEIRTALELPEVVIRLGQPTSNSDSRS